MTFKKIQSWYKTLSAKSYKTQKEIEMFNQDGGGGGGGQSAELVSEQQPIVGARKQRF